MISRGGRGRGKRRVKNVFHRTVTGEGSVIVFYENKLGRRMGGSIDAMGDWQEWEQEASYPGRACQARRMQVRLCGAGTEDCPRPHLLRAAASAVAYATRRKIRRVLLWAAWLACDRTMG